MKLNNPSHRPEIVQKALATREKNGTLRIWKGERGGNGHYTKEQLIIFGLLYEKDSIWELECPAITGHSTRDKSGYPPVYKLDIGHSQLKIGLEIDGEGHNQNWVKLKDKKKEEKLKELGWKILRFTNQEVMKDPSKVIFQILKEIKDGVNFTI
jgi:hypothetical protein